MTYEELFKQADKLAAQAEDLRKQANELKTKEAKRQKEKIFNKRCEVIETILSYYDALGILPEKDDEVESVVDIIEQALCEIEDIVANVNNIAKKSTIKVNDKVLSDEEKIKAFLKMLQ